MFEFTIKEEELDKIKQELKFYRKDSYQKTFREITVERDMLDYKIYSYNCFSARTNLNITLFYAFWILLLTPIVTSYFQDVNISNLIKFEFITSIIAFAILVILSLWESSKLKKRNQMCINYVKYKILCDIYEEKKDRTYNNRENRKVLVKIVK